MNNIILSVIIPVYNTDKYLDECVESIIGQNYQDIEIIMVDDGSTDGSGEKCDYYSRKYTNITVVHKKHEGVSAARNSGVKEARGRYITFVDSDDYINKNTYNMVMKYVIEYDLDLAAYGFYTDKPIDNVNIYENVKQKDAIKMCITDDINNMMCASVCNKIFNLKRLKRSLYFDESLTVGEDMCVTIECIMESDRMGQIRRGLYHYRKRNTNSSNTYKNGKAKSVNAHKKIIEIINKKYPEYEKIVRKRSALQSYQLLKQAIRVENTDNDINILIRDIMENRQLIEKSDIKWSIILSAKIPMLRKILRFILIQRGNIQ